MKIYKRTGLASGEGSLWHGMVMYPNKGIQNARRKAEVIRMSETDEIIRTREIFRQLATASRELTDSQRSAWGTTFPWSAYLREVHDSCRLPSIMRKHSIVPSSWRHAFMFSNMCAAYANLSFPRFYAPMASTDPPLPHDVKAALDPQTFKINGSFTISGAVASLEQIVLRIWVGMQYVDSSRGKIQMLFNLGKGPIANMVVPFSIDYVRCAGRAFGVDTLALKDILFGRVYIWADCIATGGARWGAKCSAYSALASIEMPIKVDRRLVGKDKSGVDRYDYQPKPGHDVSPLAMKVLDRAVNYRREIMTRYKTTRVERITSWRITDTATPSTQNAIVAENPNAPKKSSIKIYDKYGNEVK